MDEILEHADGINLLLDQFEKNYGEETVSKYFGRAAAMYDVILNGSKDPVRTEQRLRAAMGHSLLVFHQFKKSSRRLMLTAGTRLKEAYSRAESDAKAKKVIPAFYSLILGLRPFHSHFVE